MLTPFPSSIPAFQRAFPDEAACRAHLLSLRSGESFRCPSCGHDRAWSVRTRGVLTCASCRRQVSVTSGTALDRTRLPLSLVFLAAFLVATTPGMNAVTLARQIGVERHATAWLLLSKLRRAMAATLTEPLTGTVEADEAWFGGPQDAEKRRRYGVSALMVLALAEARKDGRVRLVRINDNRTETLLGAIRANVAPGSSITTDGWRGYNALPRAGYPHTRLAHPKNWTKTGQRSTPYADELISASKRWLVGTYQKPARAHLPAYLAEFAFRREIRDPGARFEALLRALVAAPVRTRAHMTRAADLPAIPGRVAPPKAKPSKRLAARKAKKKPATTRKRAAQPVV